ncbi:MAG: MBL fold metallo-hydrolase [Thermodesulfobacteriota bacterium]
MIVTVLGSGTAAPSLKRSQSSVWVRTDKLNMFLDTGSGCLKRLMEAGGDINDIDAVFLSHFHPDHSAELVSFLFSIKYGGLNKNKKLYIMGGTGVKEFFSGLKNVYGHWINNDNNLEIIEFDNSCRGSLKFGNIIIETFPVVHRPESLAVKLTNENKKSFVYSGDMDLTENFEDFIKDCSILLIEAAMPDDRKVDGHLTPKLAAGYAKKGCAGKMILTHLYPECETKDFITEAGNIFKGEIKTAYDLMEIKL